MGIPFSHEYGCHRFTNEHDHNFGILHPSAAASNGVVGAVGFQLAREVASTSMHIWPMEN
jgi:hypothetical protein